MGEHFRPQSRIMGGYRAEKVDKHANRTACLPFALGKAALSLSPKSISLGGGVRDHIFFHLRNESPKPRMPYLLFFALSERMAGRSIAFPIEF